MLSFLSSSEGSRSECFQSNARFFVACWLLRMTVPMSFSSACWMLLAARATGREAKMKIESETTKLFLRGFSGLILGSDDGSSFCIADLEGHGWKASEARRSQWT